MVGPFIFFDQAGPAAFAPMQMAHRRDGETLVRLQLDGQRIVKEERLLEGALGRIRDVRQGPDGLLYLLIDSKQGRIVRLEPQ